MILNVNGQSYEVQISSDTPLLWALRDHLRLTGTKFGCGMGLCGACTVHVDGNPVRSCQFPVGAVGKHRITTIEGVASAAAEAVKAAWVKHDVAQCGYCQPGQIMSATALLEENPNPDEQTIAKTMSGNICRCATYARIRTAIEDAARSLG